MAELIKARVKDGRRFNFKPDKKTQRKVLEAGEIVTVTALQFERFSDTLEPVIVTSKPEAPKASGSPKGHAPAKGDEK